mmetsp:Transcript_15318/g.35286  ORF Transcript_15318/g.35286 Transcript_15318/m.35286 type:complete len:113 (-) Transcript_15318:783-1121(-)
MGNGCVKVAAVAAAAPVVAVVGTGVVLGGATAGAMKLASGHLGTDGGKNSINDPEMQSKMILEQQRNASRIRQQVARLFMPLLLFRPQTMCPDSVSRCGGKCSRRTIKGDQT